MCGEWSSRSKGQAKLNLSWEEFEVAQRPTKCLLTLGTRHYDDPCCAVQTDEIMR